MKTGSIVYSYATVLVAASAIPSSKAIELGPRALMEGLGFDPNDSAVVIIDPQNDFLSPTGVTWGTNWSFVYA